MVRIGGDESTPFINANCDAHAQIDEYEIEGTKLKVTFLLLAATDRTQVGKTLKETFTLERGKAASKTWDLVEAVRLVPLGVRKQDLDFDETKLKGRQAYVKIHLERGQTLNASTGKYEDDPTKPMYPRIGFQAISDVWAPQNATLPKDQAMLAYWPPLPGQGPNQATNAVPNPQHAQQTPQTQNPPPAAGTPPAMNW